MWALHTGRFTINVGGMFSGKSTELLRQERRNNLANKFVRCFKPRIDQRYREDSIVTHDQIQILSIPVDDSRELLLRVQADRKPDVVLIDEVQFFDEGIIPAIEQLLVEGVDVVAAGLDLDRFGRPFGVVPHLMAIADDVRKFHAVCADCGEDAWISHGIFESDAEIVVGEREKYVPLCRGCYIKRLSEKGVPKS